MFQNPCTISAKLRNELDMEHSVDLEKHKIKCKDGKGFAIEKKHILRD